MKLDLIFSIYVAISSYLHDFSVLRDFIICSTSFGVVHLRPVLWVKFVKSLFHKISGGINTIVILIYNIIFNLSLSFSAIATKYTLKVPAIFFDQ